MGEASRAASLMSSRRFPNITQRRLGQRANQNLREARGSASARVCEKGGVAMEVLSCCGVLGMGWAAGSGSPVRYQVFYEEMSAIPDLARRVASSRRGSYDAVCDHLLVVDDAATCANGCLGRPQQKVVGTYRVLRQDIAERTLGFYTQSEYDIAPLFAARPHHRFMELGRSCVLEPYRNKRTVELLWHGLWTYVREHKVDVMIGCASLPGTDPAQHAMALSFLHHNALAPIEWRCRAHDRLYVRWTACRARRSTPSAR